MSLTWIRQLLRRNRLTAVAAVLLAWGCGVSQPFRPTALTPNALPPTPEPILGRTMEVVPGGPGPGPLPVEQSFDVVVEPHRSSQVSGGRFKLTFPSGAVQQTIDAKLTQPDTSQVLFELEPHGQQFTVPMVLEISYKGTVADPDSPDYDGSVPVLRWFNPGSGVWEEVRGVRDEAERVHIVELRHFSTYALTGKQGPIGGKGGW
ncbi:MAG: hypothetical protein HOP12_10095 [Candidatus Eisenbacteria bacterium]|uniref:ZU5 domain-containing protein n=1 Tax=Eiseniibacteriota bacterium TaxID=2212470 RepID=A0A849SFI4_UNCEI|nr:hypothetical protein [Candidatus Eisenbacteria bacterium]